MPYSPCLLNAQVKTVFLTSYNYAFYLLSFFITSNFYSQFRLTQTYGLNVFLFFAIFFIFFFFSWEICFFFLTHFFICPNVPKICLKLAYALSSEFLFKSFLWGGPRAIHYYFLFFLSFLLRVVFLFRFANEMIISFRFLRCSAIIGECVCRCVCVCVWVRMLT